MSPLDAERMPVDWLARELNTHTFTLCGRIGSNRPDLADQLRRAAASVSINIAEGAGEYRPMEKARFYRTARRSATECAGILDAALDCRLLTNADLRMPRELVRRIVGQLVRLAKAMESADARRTRDVPPKRRP